jgi:hypothetical protein
MSRGSQVSVRESAAAPDTSKSKRKIPTVGLAASDPSLTLSLALNPIPNLTLTLNLALLCGPADARTVI